MHTLFLVDEIVVSHVSGGKFRRDAVPARHAGFERVPRDAAIVCQKALHGRRVDAKTVGCVFQSRRRIIAVQIPGQRMERTGASKGVFATTSHFALAASEYARSSSKSVILIDRDELTRLMEEYGVAARNYRILELKMVDTEKYDDAEG